MKIEIKSTEIGTRNGISPKTGQPYSIREQAGYVSLESEAYPVRVAISLAPEQLPFSPGYYVVSESSFFIDRFQKLSIGRLDLRPVTVAKVV